METVKTGKRRSTGKITTVSAALDSWAAATPNVPAVISSSGQQLTYAALSSRIDALATMLRDYGVRPGRFVATSLSTSIDSIVATFAIMKAGAAFAPLDPEWPRERIDRVLDRLSPTSILANERSLSHVHHRPELVVNLTAQPDRRRGSPPDTAAESEDVAYAIHTSGSTGLPKAVLVSHRSVLNLVKALTARIYVQHGDHSVHVGVNAPPHFDASIKQVMQVLNGHTLCLYEDETRLDPRLFLEASVTMKVDVVDCTPSQVRALLEEGLGGGESSHPGCVLIGGEAIDRPLWRRLASLPSCRAYNMYGPSEATVDATVCRIEGDTPSIGEPLDNVSVYVLDEGCEPVAAGARGELCIGGEGLARGYANAAELTATRFVPSPFSHTPGARLYRTGDAARWQPGGRLEYLGRLDRQVKVRGYRVELGEIEAACMEQPSVGRAAAVVVVDTDGSDTSIVVYLVPATGFGDVSGDVRARLRELLPAYMQPSRIVVVPSLQLTSNGKINYTALGTFDYSRGRDPAAAGLTQPRTEVERSLVDVWQQVLKLDRIGIDEDFFEIGGHSLAAMQVLARVRHRFRVTVAMTTFMEKRTIGALAAEVAYQLAHVA